MADIPKSILLVSSFMNGDTETITGLQAWMTTRGFDVDDLGVGLDDVVRTAEVREGLRRWIASGGAPAAQVLEALNRASRAIPMTLSIDGSGVTRIEPRGGSSVDRALGALLAAVHDSVARGTWSRLKICPGRGCGYVFYDLSRNRSGVWCEMAVCGNRAKASRYRDRRRASER